MQKKKLLALIVCLTLMVSVFASCGGGSSESEEPAAESTGSSIVIAKNEDATTMDPARQTTSGGIQMMSAVGEGLVKATADGKDVEPALAESWEVSDDNLTYTFTLKEGLKFSDGNDITFDDWKFTLERAATVEDSYWNYVAEDIEKIEEPEAGKLAITLKQPSPSFLARMAMFPVYAQEKARYDEVGDEAYGTEGPIMAGPYAISEYKHGEYLSVVKNENYYNADGITVDNIKFQIVADDNSKVDMLKAGEIDIAENIPSSMFEDVDAADGVSAVTSDSTLTKYLILNNKDEILSNPDVRKAISLAINREDIVKAVLNGHGDPAISYMSRYGQSYNEALDENSERDVDQAKELLAKAGYGDGFELKVLCTSGNTTEESIVTVLQGSLADVGITVTMDARDDSAYQEAKVNMEHMACIATWIDDMIDPDGLNGYWWDTSINNAYYSGFESEETNALYQASKTEMDPEKRTEDFKQLQQIYFDNTVSAPLYNSPFFIGVSDSVSGFQLTPLGAYYNLGAIAKK